MKKTSEKEIPVLFCCNSKYVSKLIVVITSVLENNKNTPFIFYIFQRDFTAADKKQLQKFNNDNCRVVFKHISDTLLENFKITDKGRQDISLDTYLRFFAPELIKEYDKIIYLDSDVIVNGDLSGLYNIDLGDNYVGGVEERCLYETDYICSHLKFSKNDVYINAGVLLMNLRKMRKDKFLDEVINQSKSILDFVTYSDQDILNILARGKIKKIDCIYNMTPVHVRDYPSKRADAVVVHYNGKYKPWTLGNCNNPLTCLYFKYFRKSFLYENQKAKVFCVYNAPSYIFENELITPIQTGTYGLYNGMDMIQACDGEQIDYKNKNYGELSAWYWVWKNYIPSHKNTEYIGFCHYRRILDYTSNNDKKTNEFLKPVQLGKFVDDFNNKYDIETVYNSVKGYDIILPRKHKIVGGLTVEQQYLDFHPKKDLDLLKKIITKDYPEYVPAMKKALSSNEAYFCLLFTMKREHFINFMEFTFDILFKLEKQSDWSGYNDYYNVRTPAYLIERFFNVWLLHNVRKHHWKILERDGYAFSEYFSSNSQINAQTLPSSGKKLSVKLFDFISFYKVKQKYGKTKYYIFGAPVLKVSEHNNKKEYRLFNFIPVWKRKIKGNEVYYKLFGIPFLKLQRK